MNVYLAASYFSHEKYLYTILYDIICSYFFTAWFFKNNSTVVFSTETRDNEEQRAENGK